MSVGSDCEWQSARRLVRGLLRGTGVRPVIPTDRMGLWPVHSDFHSRLGQPCYVLIACGTRAAHAGRMPAPQKITGGTSVPHYQGPKGRAILARPVRAGNPSAASPKPRRGGTWIRRWITPMCRPFGTLRVASCCTGADAPAYNVSPPRGWRRSNWTSILICAHRCNRWMPLDGFSTDFADGIADNELPQHRAASAAFPLCFDAEALAPILGANSAFLCKMI
jgi:hypothetical protein